MSDVERPIEGQTAGGPTLLRVMGIWMATSVVVGNVIGSGIFFKPGDIARNAHNFPTIITAWVVAGLICACGSVCFAELSAMFPRSGGMYVYLREAYGELVGFMHGWTEFLFGRPASTGALAVAFAANLANACNWQTGETWNAAIACVAIVLFSFFNGLGVAWGGQIQAWTTAGKILSLVGLSLLPFLLPLFGEGGAVADNYATKLANADGDGGASLQERLALVMLSILWAYHGWHDVTPVAEEIRDPQRNVPRALFWGTGIVTLLYCSTNIAYHGVLSVSEVAAAGKETPHRMLESLFGTGGQASRFMSLVIMWSTLGAMNANILTAPRVSFAMGRDGSFFRGLGLVHATYRTPLIAIIVQAVMSLVLVVVSAYCVQHVDFFIKEKTMVFDLLTNFVVFSSQIFFTLTVLAVFVLRYSRPNQPRPYRVLGYPFVPILYVAFSAWFLWQVFEGNRRESLIGLAMIAPAPFVYLAHQYWDKGRLARNNGSNTP